MSTIGLAFIGFCVSLIVVLILVILHELLNLENDDD
jgi:hypothetical protein